MTVFLLLSLSSVASAGILPDFPWRDADGDGWYVGAGDCDDADPLVHPAAYDRPDDGLDGNCDGVDRHFDGLVLDARSATTWDVTVDLPATGQYDVAVLLDTTCSMTASLSALSFTDLADELSAFDDVDLQYGFATFDDYPTGSMGTVGSDLPFQLRQQITDDIDAVEREVGWASIHNGADGPESSIEALYQALTGAGYDLDCDGTYDSRLDVLPFLASSSDPFGGLGGESYDADSSGGGTVGGMGFRELSTPIVVLVTDNYMRDPDAGYTSPGGCPLDAGSSDLTSASDALGAWGVLATINSTYPESQMEALAESAGWVLDPDGSADPLVVNTTASSLNDDLAAIISAVLDEVGDSAVLEEVQLVVDVDDLGLVTGLDPDPATEVDTRTTSDVTFTVALAGPADRKPGVRNTTIVFDVQADGRSLGTVELPVEIPPR